MSEPEVERWTCSRVALTLVPVVWFGFMLFFCLMGSSPDVVIRVPLEVALGWVLFVAEVAPKVRPNPSAIGLFVACVALVVGGVHSFGRWLSGSWPLRASLALVGLFLLMFVAGVAAVGLAHQATWLVTGPGMFRSTGKMGNEVAAIGQLKTIATSQSLFREGDKEKDGTLDYGTLEELEASQLVDSVLGNGTRQGYVFQACPSVVTPELLWFATAAPVLPQTGDRLFFANQSGVIFYTVGGAFPPADRVACEPPAGWLRVGR